MKTALIVGGTSGIGEAISKYLASLQVNVIISGRNQKAADGIIQAIQVPSYKGKAEFAAIDMTSISNIKHFARSFQKNRPSLDYLIITAGMMRLGGRQETAEGIDDKMCVHYYGRFALIEELLPLLEKTSNEGEARILSVLAPTKGKMVDEKDLDLKTSYGIKAAADACSLYNDLMSFSLLYPSISFVHAYPGVVKTPLFDSMPWFLKGPLLLISPFMRKPSDCAKYLIDAFLQPSHSKGWWLINENGQPLPPCNSHTESNRELVYKHTIDFLKRYNLFHCYKN